MIISYYSDELRKTLRVLSEQHERWFHVIISGSQVTRWSVNNMESARTTKNVILSDIVRKTICVRLK